jgi:site-specific recombinase XerD
MINKYPQVSFIYNRRHIAAPERKAAVELRINYNRKQKFISTGVSVLKHHWDEKTQRLKGHPSAMEYNTILSTMEKRALKIIAEMVEKGRVDILAIPTLLRSQTTSMTFLEYMMQRMEKKQVTENTHRSHVTTYNKVVEFGKIKYFSDITPSNIRAFSEWLHAYKMPNKKKYSQATIYKITSNLSLFISDAVVDGYVTDNPYVTKRMNENKGGTRIDQYLIPEEVEKIEKAKMPTQAVERSRDLFLLQCYTGMAYVDLMTYDFRLIGDDNQLCRGVRHKTGTEFVFYVTDKARALLYKYGYKLPKLSNQKYNAHLKIVADAAGIDKPITSHMGRRTAGSIWLNMGIPIDVVAKCLGHQSIQVTQRAYAKILDTTVQDAFEKLKQESQPH